MQVIPAIFGSMFSTGAAAAGTGLAGISAAGTAAAGAATGVAGSTLFSMSTLGSILSGGATVLSALSSLSAGQQQSAAYQAEAAQASVDAVQETIDGRQRRDGLRRDLIARLGENDVAYSASGLDLSFGTPVVARDESVRSASAALSNDLSNEEAKRRRLVERSDALKRMAKSARQAGAIKAGGLLLSGGADILQRG